MTRSDATTGGTGHRTTPTSTSSRTAQVPPLTRARAAQLSAELAGGTDAGLRAALVMPADQKLDPAAARALSAVSPITFDVASFRSTSRTSATVSGSVAHPTSGSDARWQFTLMRVANVWKIADAEPSP
jgi:hypothetical protein